MVSQPATPPPAGPTQTPDSGSGPRHDAIQKFLAADRPQAAAQVATPLTAEAKQRADKLATARAKHLTDAAGPDDGAPPAPRRRGLKAYEDSDFGAAAEIPLVAKLNYVTAAATTSASAVTSASTAAAADTGYGATYSPATTFDVQPSYSSPGYMWVTVANTGTFTWTANSVSLGYHLNRSDGTVVNYNGLSSRITTDVPPGYQVQIYASIQYLPAGNFELVWDLRDSTGFFSAQHVVAARAIQFVVPHYPPAGLLNNPPDGGTVDSTAPTLNVVVRADGTVANGVDFQVCTSPADPDTGGNTCWYSPRRTVPWTTGSFAGNVSWNPPANTLKWNTAYYWRARVADSSFTTPWSDFSSFIPVVTTTDGAHYATGSGATDTVGVDLYLNNYTRTEKDFTVQAPGFDLDFKRTYNSANTMSGSFGQGWSSILDMRTSVSPAGILSVNYPDGRQVNYGKDPDGSYVPAYGESGEARVLGPDLLILDGASYYFNASGRLYEIDPPTYQSSGGGSRKLYPIVFGYNGTGQVIRIGEGDDFNLVVGWTADGHVASIGQLSGSRFWTYDYTGGRLAHACDPRTDLSACTAYAWTGSQLTSFSNPNGAAETTTITYNANGTVASVKVPGVDSAHSTWQYTRATPPAGSPMDAKLVDVVTDPRGTSMSYEFSYTGRLRARWYGNGVPGPNQERLWTYGPWGQVASLYDENGNITSYAFGPEGWLGAVTRWRDGQTQVTTSYQHDTFEGGVLLPATDQRYGKVTQILDADMHVTTMAYNADGNVVSQSVAPSRGAAPIATTTHTYTCDGNTASPIVVNDPTIPGYNTLQPCGLLASTTDPDGRVTTYAYDHIGHLTKVTTPAGEVTNTYYDATGHVAKKIVVTGSTSAETDYTYDADGRVLTTKDPAVVNPITGVTHQLLTTNTYDADGNLKSSTQSDLTPVSASGDAPGPPRIPTTASASRSRRRSTGPASPRRCTTRWGR
ncbi:DUF6531 domain-containing protein [Catenulispora yoronensis]